MSLAVLDLPRFVLKARLVQLADQLGRERRRQLVGNPRRQVALRVRVRHVAQLAAAAGVLDDTEA